MPIVFTIELQKSEPDIFNWFGLIGLVSMDILLTKGLIANYRGGGGGGELVQKEEGH